MRVPRLQTKPTHSAIGNESLLRNGRCGNRFWSRFLPHRNLCSFPHRARNPKPVCPRLRNRRFRCAHSRPRPRTRPQTPSRISPRQRPRGGQKPTHSHSRGRRFYRHRACRPCIRRPRTGPARRTSHARQSRCHRSTRAHTERCAQERSPKRRIPARAIRKTCARIPASHHPLRTRFPCLHRRTPPWRNRAAHRLARTKTAHARCEPQEHRARSTRPTRPQARANRNAFSLNTMLRRGATSPGMTCMNSKFTKRAPQRAAIA